MGDLRPASDEGGASLLHPRKTVRREGTRDSACNYGRGARNFTIVPSAHARSLSLSLSLSFSEKARAICSLSVAINRPRRDIFIYAPASNPPYTVRRLHRPFHLSSFLSLSRSLFRRHVNRNRLPRALIERYRLSSRRCRLATLASIVVGKGSSPRRYKATIRFPIYFIKQ